MTMFLFFEKYSIFNQKNKQSLPIELFDGYGKKFHLMISRKIHLVAAHSL